MTSDRYPTRAAPLALHPNEDSGPLPITTARFGPGDPGSLHMAIRVSRARTGDAPTGPPQPRFSMQADDGPPCLVEPFPSTGEVIDAAGVVVGSADVQFEPNDVYLVLVRVPAPRAGPPPARRWALHIRNTDIAAPRRFVWVVSDVRAETAQPWLALPEPVELVVAAGAGPIQHPLRIDNAGTGPLRIDDAAGTDLGSGFVLTTVPGPVAPNSRSRAVVTFATPEEAATLATAYTPVCTDPDAGIPGRPETRVTLRARVLGVQWRRGDVLVADPRAVSGQPAARPGALVRIAPDGSQSVVTAGGLLTNPTGVAIEPGGNAVVCDSGAFGGGGGVVRVDRVTGMQAAVASGGPFRDPSAIVVDGTGGLLVADPSVPALIHVDAATGVPRVVVSTPALGRPVGLAPGSAAGTVVVLDAGTSAAPPAVLVVEVWTGTRTVLCSGPPLREPTGITAVGDGRLLVTDTVSGLVAVAPDGTQTTLAAGLPGPPVRIAAEPGGTALVAVHGSATGDEPALLRVTPGTAAPVRVSSGALLRAPVGLAVVD